MVTTISPQNFLQKSSDYTIIDVRSPAEFAKGHIPGAHNIPLFSDTERALVGTAYKHEGKQNAMRLGMEIFGPQISKYIDEISKISNNKPVVIYCWRGGMRSKSICMILQFFGLHASQLLGGYKALRSHLYEKAEKPRKLILLGGATGCGKTKILKALKKFGEQVVDLEHLAHHKGSVFGGLGEQPQPTQEQFITNVLLELYATDSTKPVWIEKESSRIGKLTIPYQLWHHMQLAPVISINLPKKNRIMNLIEDYGTFSPEQLRNCLEQITKQLTVFLGREQTKQIAQLLQEKNYAHALELLLPYYDRLYAYNMQKDPRKEVYHITLTGTDTQEHSHRLLSVCHGPQLNQKKEPICTSR